MAFSEIYVDPSIAADSGRGTRATITLSAATFTTGTWNLNETAAFASYTWVSGDEIYISGGTAVTAGLYTISSKTDADNIVLAGDITTDASSPTDVTSDSAPYGDLEYAIEQTTFDLTNGTRVNIKAGTDEVLAAGLHTAMADTSVSIAWVPAQTSPLIFEGYTTTAGDGGIGQIDGSGLATSVYISTSHRKVSFVNLAINGFNNGASGIIRASSLFNSVIGCHVHTNSSGPGIYLGTYATCVGNYVHDCGTENIRMATGICAFNIVKNNLEETSNGGIVITDNATVLRNIVHVDGASDGIITLASTVIGNSIYSAAGTGSGIVMTDADGSVNVVDNCIEGFSGVGGVGLDLNFSDSTPFVVAGNSIYDCATDSSGVGLGIVSDLDAGEYYETLAASPFTDVSTMDFSPVDTGTVKEGSAFKFWTI